MATCTVPPPGEYLIAFVTRLLSSCSILSRQHGSGMGSRVDRRPEHMGVRCGAVELHDLAGELARVARLVA
ncbi:MULTISPECIES: hypothetical protein [Sorangium]|uniref:hypothetical protein n=1 Tax=Sorangium TaxID=39643 RepID=UPI0005D17B2A|nr:hypothetical protein [Sorangium cellulosum]